jgi:hypothetical protein
MKKLLTIIFLLCASVAHADMTFTDSDQSTESNADPKTHSFSCTSGADVLVLGISGQIGSSRAGGAPTYNAAPMTIAGSLNTIGAEGDVEVWYLIDPGCTGSGLTVSVPNTGTATLLYMSMVTFSAAAGSTTAFVEAVNDGNGSNAAPATVTCTPNQSGDAMYGMLHWGNNATTDWGTFTGNEIFKFDLGQEVTGAYYQISTDANPFLFSVDDDGSSGPDTDDYGFTCVVFEQAEVGAGPTRRRMIIMSEALYE